MIFTYECDNLSHHMCFSVFLGFLNRHKRLRAQLVIRVMDQKGCGIYLDDLDRFFLKVRKVWNILLSNGFG